MSKIVVGDIHTWDISNKIKFKQTELFLNWLCEQDFNNSENVITFLGDIFESMSVSPSTIAYIINYFYTKMKFKKIQIVQGNHDCNITDSLLNLFRDIPNVEVIDELIYRTEDDINYLYLPHYEHEGTTKLPRFKYYNSWVKEHYDELKAPLFVFGHLETDDSHFGDDYFDTKLLPKFENKGNDCNILFGHVHSANFMNGGSFLGSAIKNSSTEKDDKKYLAFISDDGCWTPIEIPNFMSYIVCDYGDIPNIETPLAMLQINNAPTKKDAELFYEEKFGKDKVGFTKIYTKRDKIMIDGKITNNTMNEKDLFDNFSKEKELSNEVIEICKKVL